ncbi:acyl-CoA dehydrogenase family protein [Gordonia shandongensis]|uniref:acyl-CoA dehydrogenase family protein n=1 Tax=Gordonia shandongensis TaxID=376351 RepID=UPI000417CD88|nr:acyl-CoA dehydrogenase family protein [Gordonia shandongensis]
MNAMIPGADPALAEVATAVFGAQPADAPCRAGAFDDALWTRLTGLGVGDLIGEEGGTWFDAAEILSRAATEGVRAPIAEHALIARTLIAEPADARLRTVAFADADGVARGVPWGRDAERIVVVWPAGDGHLVADADASRYRIVERTANVLGEPRDTVAFDVSASRAAGLDAVGLDAAGLERARSAAALTRAVQTCAALDAALALSVEHAGARTQFGRPLARFQAVQHLLADIAAHCALARSATEAALAEAVRTDWGSERLPLLVAVARSCVGHSASSVVRGAHQVHGAIGTTREHSLHRFTRAALVWRGEYGSVAHWDRVVGDAAAAAGPDGLWHLVVG